MRNLLPINLIILIRWQISYITNIPKLTQKDKKIWSPYVYYTYWILFVLKTLSTNKTWSWDVFTSVLSPLCLVCGTPKVCTSLLTLMWFAPNSVFSREPWKLSQDKDPGQTWDSSHEFPSHKQWRVLPHDVECP